MLGFGQASDHLRAHTQELARQLGAPPVPGTLNLVLRRPVGFDFTQVELRCGGRFFWAASVAGIPALGYRWLYCPLHLLEIVAPVMLRTHLAVGDGDKVSVVVEGTRALTLKQRLSWSILWSLRQDRYYRSDYRVLIKRFERLRRYASQISMV